LIVTILTEEYTTYSPSLGEPTHLAVPQENFNKANASHNLSLRIPTPVFGGGLVDAIDDATILNSHAATAAARAILGI